MTTTKHPPWDSNVVEGVAKSPRETSYGLTGSEIGSLLHPCKVPDLLPGATKRHRLREDCLSANPAIRHRTAPSSSSPRPCNRFATGPILPCSPGDRAS